MIWPILIIAFVLRLISINQSLWLDEAINVMAVKDNTLVELITNYSKVDFHPPGYVLMLALWTKLLGFSELSIRFPSIVFGVITVYLSYLIGQKIHSTKLGLIVALILAVNPLHIYYSQEARMYSFAAMAASLNFLFFVKLIKQEKNVSPGFFLSLLLVLSSDYLAYLIIPAEIVVLVLNRNKRLFYKWLKLSIPVLLVWSWWIPFFLNQLNSGLSGASQVPGWKEVVGSSGLKPLVLTYVKFLIGRISLTNSLIYFSLFFPIGLTFFYLLFQGILKSEMRNKKLLISWIVVPLFLSLVISVFVPIYSYFRLLFLLVPFFLLVSLGILLMSPTWSKIFLVLIVAIEFSCSTIYLFNPTFQREDWKSLAIFLTNPSHQKPVLLESNGSFAPLDYYLTNKYTTESKIKPIGALKNFPAQNETDLINLDQTLDKNGRVYLLEYLVGISDPRRIVQKKLDQLGYRRLDIYNFNGVGFIYLYQK